MGERGEQGFCYGYVLKWTEKNNLVQIVTIGYNKLNDELNFKQAYIFVPNIL